MSNKSLSNIGVCCIFVADEKTEEDKGEKSNV